MGRGGGFEIPGGGRGIKFSPDGKQLATSSLDLTVRVWDVQTGEQLHIRRGHGGEIFSVAFSPDGQRLVSGSKDKTIKVWEAQRSQGTLNLKGGAWGHVRNACRPVTTSHEPEFRYYFVSFRCCADPSRPAGASPTSPSPPAPSARPAGAP